MKKLIFLAILSCCSFIQQAAFSQNNWSQIEGPYGSTNVKNLIAYDTILYATTACGIFKKTNSQAAWQLQSLQNCSSYTLKGDSLYFVSSGLFYTPMQSANFNPTTLNTYPITAISHTDSCLYGAYNMAGFLKSTDFGQTWVSYNNGLPKDTNFMPVPPYYYYTYAISGITTSGNYVFCGGKHGVYRSDGSLSLWTLMSNGTPQSLPTALYSYNNLVYATFGNSLYTSSDFGNNWTLLYQSSSNINCFYKSNSEIYLGTQINGILFSNDNGLTWTNFNNGLSDLNINTIAKSGSTLWCGTSVSGPFKYDGILWKSEHSGINCSLIQSISSTDSQLIVNNRESISKQSAGTWVNCSPNFAHDYWSILKAHHDTLVVSVEHNSSNWPYDIPFIIKSNDAGQTWDSLTNQPPFAGDDPYGINFHNNRIYAWENAQMFFTDDNGWNWTDISLPNTVCNGINGFIVHNEIPFIAACNTGQLLSLTNNIWSTTANGLSTNGEPTTFAQCDNAIFNYVNNVGMYVSFDNGSNWSYASTGLSGFNYVSDYAYQGSKLFVSTDNGIFATYNYGQQWAPLNDGLANRYVTSMYIFNDTLFAGTAGNGVWKMEIPTTLSSLSEVRAINFVLKIAPNPFNGSTMISANGLNGAGLINVRNAAGQLVTQEKIIDIASFYWDGSKLPNGFYFAEIIQNDQIKSVGKMVIANGQ